MARHQSIAHLGLEDRTYTIAEWQALEERTGERFEYHEGRLVHWQSMAGGTVEHSEIGGNLIYVLGGGVRSRPQDIHCGVHTSDLRIAIPGTDRYVYPDAAVVCGKPTYDTEVSTAITNPLLVAEVLSPSSEKYDTREKFRYYARLDSLRTYLLVDQDDAVIEVRSREEAGGPWAIVFATTSVESGRALEGTAVIPALGIGLPLAEVYRGIDFTEEEGSEGVAVPA